LSDKIQAGFFTHIGQQKESIKKAELEHGLENAQDLSKKLIISRAFLKL